MPGKGAFKRCVEDVTRKGGVDDPRAVCAASIGAKRGRTRGRVNARGLHIGDLVVFEGENAEVLNVYSPDRKGHGETILIRTESGKQYEVAPSALKRGRVNAKRAKRGKRSDGPDMMMSAAKKLAMAHGGVPAVLLMANRGKGKKNPVEAAAVRFADFHGMPARDVMTWDEPYHYHGVTSDIGSLVSLVVKLPKERAGGKGFVTVQGLKGARLTMNENGTQLFIEGGDQSLDLDDFAVKTDHDREYLGELVQITYHTDKKHLGNEGGKADYVHRFGKMESNGRKTELPKVGYDRLNEEILISGGGYTIPAEGIDG